MHSCRPDRWGEYKSPLEEAAEEEETEPEPDPKTPRPQDKWWQHVPRWDLYGESVRDYRESGMVRREQMSRQEWEREREDLVYQQSLWNETRGGSVFSGRWAMPPPCMRTSRSGHDGGGKGKAATTPAPVPPLVPDNTAASVEAGSGEHTMVTEEKGVTQKAACPGVVMKTAACPSSTTTK